MNKMKFVHINHFHCFEKQQLEDYLNDMSQKGYHLKNIFSHFFKFEYDPSQQFHYFIDLQVDRKPIFRKYPTDEYIDIFANEGYHFLGNFNYFHIFMSKNEKEYYNDDDNDISLKDIYRYDLNSSIQSLVVILLTVFIILKLKILDGGDISFLSNQTEIGIIISVLPLYLVEIIDDIIPILKYKKNKQVNYHYQQIIKRGYISDGLTTLFFLLMASFISYQPIKVICLFCLLSFVMIVIGSIFINKNENHFFSYNLLFGFLIVGLSFSIIRYCSHNYKPEKHYIQNNQIAEINIEFQSILMNNIVYELKDYDDYLNTVEVYYPFLDNYVLKLLTRYEDYHKEGNIYVSKEHIIVQKDNMFIEMPKEFYKNHLNDIYW